MNDLVPASLTEKMLTWRHQAKPWKPWAYQERALKFLLEHGQAGLLLEPGLGKTSISLAAVKILLGKKLMRRVLVVAPLRAIYDVWPAEISDWEDFHNFNIAILHGGNKDKVLRQLEPRHQLALINFEGLPWLMTDKTRMKQLDADTLIIDECFVAGVLINSSSGMTPIESLKCGDKVHTEFGQRVITKCVAYAPKGDIVEVKIGAKKIRCTEDHPFFTDLGWLPAKCVEGRRVLSLADVRNLQKATQSVSESRKTRYASKLLYILCSEVGVEQGCNDGRQAPQKSCQNYGQSYVHSESWPRTMEQRRAVVKRDSTPFVESGQSERSYLENAWWEWTRFVESGNVGAGMPAKSVYLQLSSRVGWKASWLSYKLQSGFWESNQKSGDRSGRQQSSCAAKKDRRQKERSETQGTRVESVSYLERGSVPLVYNLEVEGCPHFEIESCALVHNSSKMKASNTLRFRVIRPHLQEFKRRYILTGSPRPKNYLDLFAQIYLLDRGAALGAYITHYKNTFFYPTGYDMREWALLPGADKKINALVAPMVLRLDAKDYLKLPKEMERVHHVELPPKARAEYDQIEKNFMSTLFNAPMVNSAAARSKCCQIANGGVYLDPTPQDDRWPSRDRPVRFVHTAKVDALVELYEELQGEQLMVAIGYHHDVTAIRAALRRDIPCINGQTTKNQASDYIDQWNSGELDLLLVHPASAGHALNLQKFSPRHVAFFYITDDYDQFDQCWRRVWRQGNKAEWVMRHLFIADDTVDVPKLANLRRKGDGQNDFLRAMKVYAEKRYGKL